MKFDKPKIPFRHVVIEPVERSDGFISQKQTIRETDDFPQKGLNAPDYSLQNIIDAEARDYLNPAPPIQRDILSQFAQAEPLRDALNNLPDFVPSTPVPDNK